MNKADVEKWFDELSTRRAAVRHRGGKWYVRSDAASWIAEAESAVASTFPLGHPALAPFLALKSRADSLKLLDLGFSEYFESAVGAFEAARSILKAGRIFGLVEGIQAETVGQLLDQADALHGGGYFVAAAVVAGGALETHLLHLCRRVGATWQGEGTISKYNGAIGQLRNQGASVYSANDGKSVEAWGGLRNEAAHAPASFGRGKREIELMIEGVRQFVERNP